MPGSVSPDVTTCRCLGSTSIRTRREMEHNGVVLSHFRLAIRHDCVAGQCEPTICKSVCKVGSLPMHSHFRSRQSSSDVELELLEVAIVHAAPRTSTHPAVPLILNQGFHTGPANPTYAVGTCIAFFEHAETPTPSAVDLHGLCGSKHWRCVVGVHSTGRHNVEL